jgi:hypothetical protein
MAILCITSKGDERRKKAQVALVIIKEKMYTPFQNIPCNPIQSRYTVIDPVTPCNADAVYRPNRANTCEYITYTTLRRHTYEPYTVLGSLEDDEAPPSVIQQAQPKCNCGL